MNRDSGPDRRPHLWRLACILLAPLLVALFSTQSASAQTATAVRLVVLDGHDSPVVGLMLTLVPEESAPHEIQTDATGVAVAGQLSGTAFGIVAARLADGTVVQIEGTTIDQGLRLGLLPGEERTVLLRLDQNLLYVDPETIFSGATPPAIVATVLATRAIPITATPVLPTSPTTAPATATPVASVWISCSLVVLTSKGAPHALPTSPCMREM